MAKKNIHFRTEAQKKFYHEYQTLLERRSSWEVWSDWVEAVAIIIEAPFEFRNKVREERFERLQNILKRYTESEQKTFDRMFEILVDALEENPEQDFLGNMFETLNLTDHWKAQFFTPYDIADLMARLIGGSTEQILRNETWTDILDPCSGAGVLLIALRNYMMRSGIGYDRVLYVGQDVDKTAALMGYIQISLLGCAGYIIVGNSLSYPVTHYDNTTMLPHDSEHYELWFTPIYRSPIWETRRCLALMKSQSNNNKVKDYDKE